jgi:RNA-directed DNA polymerase
MRPNTNISLFARANKTALRAYVGRYYPTNGLYGCKLNALVLLSIETLGQLGWLIGHGMSALEEAINTPGYQHYTIRKKSGGERHIFAPCEQLKQIQQRLNDFLQAYYLWIKPEEVYGFVINPGCLGRRSNIVENASVHVGRKHILNIDLKDFFPTISAGRIKQLFLSPYFNFGEPIAIALTLLTTYQGRLPTGAPTSPVLSNFVCLQLDAALQGFCRDNGLRFTRYADDLTFSAAATISEDTINRIIRIINDDGFEINHKKLHIRTSNRRQTVTGLTVNEKVNVDRKLLKKIRAMLHDLKNNGIEAAARRHFKSKSNISSKDVERFINRLKGYINFVGQVRGKDDDAYKKFAHALLFGA